MNMHIKATSETPANGWQERAGRGGTLLIYAPVPLYHDGRTLMVEQQACNGIHLWAANFDRVIVVMPLTRSRPNGVWIPIQEAAFDATRIRIESVPTAYRPDQFFRALPAARAKLRRLIGEADYLSFAIGGLFGDWGAVSAIEAHKMGRPYAVWTDRVESEVVRKTAQHGSARSRLRARLTHRPMAWLERFVIRRAALGLFHGRETFEAYAPFCSNPHIVHDIHLKKEDHLDRAAVASKIADCRAGPLRLVYVGRADAMKGPLDWIATLERLARQGVDFRATWLGEGDLHQTLVERIRRSSLGDKITAPGFASDRAHVLAALREAHAFLFCHLTPESPRCLIEALVSACPIVGYGSAFSEDLIETHGGGSLVPVGDVEGLVTTLSSLEQDRDRLATLIGRAALDGAPFDDVSVFAHRSEIIKANLAGPSGRS